MNNGNSEFGTRIRHIPECPSNQPQYAGLAAVRRRSGNAVVANSRPEPLVIAGTGGKTPSGSAISPGHTRSFRSGTGLLLAVEQRRTMKESSRWYQGKLQCNHVILEAFGYAAEVCVSRVGGQAAQLTGELLSWALSCCRRGNFRQRQWVKPRRLLLT